MYTWIWAALNLEKRIFVEWWELSDCKCFAKNKTTIFPPTQDSLAIIQEKVEWRSEKREHSAIKCYLWNPIWLLRSLQLILPVEDLYKIKLAKILVWVAT